MRPEGGWRNGTALVFLSFYDFKSFNMLFQHVTEAGEISPPSLGDAGQRETPSVPTKVCPSVRREGTIGADTGRTARPRGLGLERPDHLGQSPPAGPQRALCSTESRRSLSPGRL